jgi:peptide/nickel transport system substrate-binding protein
VLALFYEPPIERVRYGWEPRLVTHIPTLSSGDVITRLVAVTQGTRYLDQLGLIRQFTGTTGIELPQLVVTFTLQADLHWSDGEPIAAADAVLGYHLAQSPEAEGRWRDLAERTAKFVAVDELTLRWEGLPGYLDADYPGFLFPLQPAHRWQGQGLASILADRTPPATGPMKIVAWEAQREVRLEPNPYYNGEPPTLVEVIVRFPQYDPEHWDSLLITGECDVVLPDPIAQSSWQQWAQLSRRGEVVLWADAALAVLRLDMNLPDPASDDGATTDEQPSPLADIRVREAVARCVNRSGLTQALPAEAMVAAYNFLPPNQPAQVGTPAHSYDTTAAKALLTEAGWVDADRDGVREAQDVEGFDDGEPLELTFHFLSSYFVIAAHVAADLETCGFDLELQPTDVRRLYAGGGTSPLFSRQFQLALLGWQVSVPEICGAWLSTRIPEADNNWIGENFSGFASEAYDAACLRALSAVDAEAQGQALNEAVAILDEQLPTQFLAWRPFWFAARPAVQGLIPDASAEGTIWNIEAITVDSRSSD